MHRLREHIYWLDCFNFVIIAQYLQIAGLGCGITTDVDNFLWCSTQQHLRNVFMHARSRRVCDDDIRTTVGSEERFIKKIFNIAGKEIGVVNIVDL